MKYLDPLSKSANFKKHYTQYSIHYCNIGRLDTELIIFKVFFLFYLGFSHSFADNVELVHFVPIKREVF
jgi:hypothetical protein